MPYVGGKLAPWFGSAPIKLACHRMADDGGRAVTSAVQVRTPMDTGHLKASIRQTPVTIGFRLGSASYESGAETSVSYAEYVERGTGLFGPYHRTYTIRPKNPDGWLRWIDPHTGLPVFAKSVTHKGSEGAYMFANGVAFVESIIDRVVAPALDAWARDQERSNPWAVPG